jgi:hypothetical protein
MIMLLSAEEGGGGRRRCRISIIMLDVQEKQGMLHIYMYLVCWVRQTLNWSEYNLQEKREKAHHNSPSLLLLTIHFQYCYTLYDTQVVVIDLASYKQRSMRKVRTKMPGT